MPYILKYRRKVNNPLTSTLSRRKLTDGETVTWQVPIEIATPGELNFAMTMLASEYVRE